MNKMQLLILFLSFLQVSCKLDTVAKSYVETITYINDYYECGFIVSFGDNEYIGDRHWKRQVISAKHKIKLKNMEEFKNVAKPLVVFFNSPDSTKFQLITSAVDTSKPVFCFFINANVRVEDFFSNVYFPYRYKFIVSQKNETDFSQEIIWKVKLDNKKKQIVKLLFATWSEETGIKSFAKLKEYKSGHILRAGLFNVRYSEFPITSCVLGTLVKGDTGKLMGSCMFKNIPIIYYKSIYRFLSFLCGNLYSRLMNPPLSNVEKIGDKFKLSGYSSELTEELQNHMNFKFTYKLVRDVGVKENGTWSGGMGLLTNNTIDILFTPLFISAERSEDVDFTLPLFESNLGMFLKKPDNAFNWSNYFEPFHITVWYIIVLIIIIESIALIVFEYYKKKYVIRRLRRQLIKIPIPYTYSFLKVFGAMCGQSLSPSNFNPLRILQLTIHITALFILTFYSAVFLSTITTPQLKLPITSFQDLIEDSRYKAGCIRGQPWIAFQQSESEAMRKIFHKHIKTQNPIPISLSEGHERMCRDEKYAFVTFDNLAYSYLSSGCILLLVEQLSKSQLGIAFQHNSPHIKVFNEHLLKMFENGLLKKIEHKHLPSFKKITESWKPISELEILSVILILLSFMLFSVILLLLEILIYRISSQQWIKSCLKRI